MTKDGIGWGAYAGVVSAQLADTGFTGSGTVFDEASMDDTLGEVFHVTRGISNRTRAVVGHNPVSKPS